MCAVFFWITLCIKYFSYIIEKKILHAVTACRFRRFTIYYVFPNSADSHDYMLLSCMGVSGVILFIHRQPEWV